MKTIEAVKGDTVEFVVPLPGGEGKVKRVTMKHEGTHLVVTGLPDEVQDFVVMPLLTHAEEQVS